MKKEGRKLREEERLQANETPRRKKENGVTTKRKEKKRRGKHRINGRSCVEKLRKTDTTGTSDRTRVTWQTKHQLARNASSTEHEATKTVFLSCPIDEETNMGAVDESKNN